MGDLREVKYFYDEISSLSISDSEDWLETSCQQAKLISNLVKDRFNLNRSLSILDCSCGSGGKAIGLALNGHKVLGSDICSSEISVAEARAKDFDFDINFQVCDFRHLDIEIEGEFNLVCSFDNAIAHVLDLNDLELVFKSMYSKLHSGGVMLVGVRDYETIVDQKPMKALPLLLEGELGRKFYFQTSDWSADKKSYNLSFLEDKAYDANRLAITTKMRAFTKNDIFDVIADLGWKTAEWLDQDETGYYQPMLAVRKSS